MSQLKTSASDRLLTSSESEVLSFSFQILATGVCHTDAHELSGHTSGCFPCVLGHEGGGVVESVGEGVTTVQPGEKGRRRKRLGLVDILSYPCRRPCYSPVHSSVWGVQVLQEPQNQPMQHNQVHTPSHQLKLQFIICCLLVGHILYPPFLPRDTQGQGVMPDGTSRFSCRGQTVFHFMGTSTFSEYTVLPEISIAKVTGE